MKKETKPGPILITGVYRSGTTLIAQMMNSHKDVKLVYDSINFMRHCYKKYDPLDDFKNVEKLVKDVRDRAELRWNIDINYEKIIEKLKNKEMSYGLIYDTLMTEFLLTNSNATIWGEKTTVVGKKIPDFFNMFPDSRVICIIRDPRAILASFKKITNAPGNDYLDAIFNCVDSMERMKEYNVRFRNKRFVTIKYEDMVSDPLETSKMICKKLEIEFDENMLNASSFTNKKGDKWYNNSMFDKNMKGISKSTIDAWKGKLEDWEIWLVEFFTSKLMLNYGYKQENIKPTEELIMKATNKIKSSKLVTGGALNYLFTKKGIERLPMDPLDPNKWDKKSFSR